MPRDQQEVPCPYGTWTELTNGDVAAITLQCNSGPAKLKVMPSAVPPPDTDGVGLVVTAGWGFSQKPLTEIAFGGGTRVFARGETPAGASFLVDHL